MDRIVITGLGAVSAVGIGKEAFWEGLISGRSGISPIESFDTSRYRTHLGGEVKNFQLPEGTERMGRCSQLAVHAAREALTDAGLDRAGLPAFRTSLTLGTTLWESPTQEQIDDLMAAARL